MQFPHVSPPCDLPLMFYVPNARNEVLCVEFKEATGQEFLLLKGKDIIAEHRASQKRGHRGAGWRFSFLLIPLSTDHCVVLRRTQNPLPFWKQSSYPGPQYHIPTLPVNCYLNFHCGNVVVTTVFPFHCHCLKKSHFSSDFLPDPVVISFSCPVCWRGLISRSVSSFSFSLRAAALCQPGLSLVFHFPVCLLSAIGHPLTCASLFPCSPCVLLAWVWLFTIPRPDLAAWLTALVWSTAVNLFLFPDSSQHSFFCFQVLFL